VVPYDSFVKILSSLAAPKSDKEQVLL